MKRRKKQWRTYEFYATPEKFFALVLVAVIVLGGAAGVRYLKYETNLFRLRHVRIEGLHYLPESKIRQFVDVPEGTPLFRVPVQAIQKKLEDYLYIRSVTIRRIIPSTLLIHVQERQPIARLVDGAVYLVDEEGTIMLSPPTMAKEDLPVITGISVAELLRKGKKPLFRALELMRRMQKVDPRLLDFIAEIRLKWEGWPELFLIRGNARVVLPPRASYASLFLLSELLNRLNADKELSRLRRIDLSLDQQIVLEYKNRKG